MGSPVGYGKIRSRTYANLLKALTNNELQQLSYLIAFKKRMLASLLDKTGNVPKAIQCKQWRTLGDGFTVRGGCVVCPMGRDSSVIPIDHTDDEVKIGTSTNANDLNALPTQRMMGMSYCNPFRRWLVKGGSVL